jgi:hypothetical protein
MASEIVSYVYFGVAEDRSGFKVGVSLNPFKRTSNFPEKIDLANSFQFSCQRSDAFRTEKSIHFLFEKYRLDKDKHDGYTEWFYFSAFDEVFKFVIHNQDKFKWIAYGNIIQSAEISDIRYIAEELTLIDRRIYNLLLANAWDNIKEPVSHPIRLHELRSSNPSNDRPRESIRRLMKAVVSFDVVEDGIKREVLTQLLGPCKLDHNPQGLAYSTFPEPIRAAIDSSTVFARFRRDLLCQFRSKYALNLYEILQKRINLSFKTSEDFEVEDLRKKLGVEKGKYLIYRDLNSRVLKPAALEVNAISDIECSFEPILEGRKTVGLRLAWRKKTTDEAVKNANTPSKQGPDKTARTAGPVLRAVGDATEAEQTAKPAKRLRGLNTRECEQLKKTFSGYDIYYFYTEFQDWLENTGGEIPKNPVAAFTNWLKSYYKITGPRQR